MSGAGAGNIVNVASIRSVIAGSKTVQYDTTKAAILGLTRSMARDHAAEGIRVNAVGPGQSLRIFTLAGLPNWGRPMTSIANSLARTRC